MKAINISCGACHAAPQERCRRIGYGDERMTKSGFHVSRVARARYETTGQKKAMREADRAAREAIIALRSKP